MEKQWWPRGIRPRPVSEEGGAVVRGGHNQCQPAQGPGEEGEAGPAVSAFGPKVGGPGDTDGPRRGCADWGIKPDTWVVIWDKGGKDVGTWRRRTFAEGLRAEKS